MRFLLSVGLVALSGCLVPCESACVVKSTSPNSNIGLCTSVESQTLDIVGPSPVTIPVATFDTTAHPGAVLDAVWINWINGVYLPDVSYRVTSSSNFELSVMVGNTWGLISNAGDNKLLSKSNLQSHTGLQGSASVDALEADSPASSGCFVRTDSQPTPHSTACLTTQIELAPFQIFDTTWKDTALTQTNTDITFSPDYSAVGTFTDFTGSSGTSSNGFRMTAGVPAAGYSSAGPGTWGLTTTNTGGTIFKVGGATTSTASGTAGLTVAVQHHLYIAYEVQYDYHFPSGGNGDPQFQGFQGQSFQVHGAPDSYFALISAPSYYVNARFDYISTGSCTYNETACFTHPGTYMGMIYVGMKDANILIQAGPHATGFGGILVNDKPMKTGDRFVLSGISADSYIQVLSKSKLILALDNIVVTVHNSDNFVNFDLSLTDKELLSNGAVKRVVPNGATPSQIQHHLNNWYGSYNPLHGLIGQTWRNVKYQDNKLFQGDITEYQLDKIIDHTFLYCVYEPSSEAQ